MKQYYLFEVVSTNGKGHLVKMNIQRGDDATKKETINKYMNMVCNRRSVESICLYKEPDGRFIFTKENPSTSGV